MATRTSLDLRGIVLSDELVDVKNILGKLKNILKDIKEEKALARVNKRRNTLLAQQYLQHSIENGITEVEWVMNLILDDLKELKQKQQESS